MRGAVERFWQDTESRYRLLRGDKARPLLPPTELFLAPDAFNGAIKPFARVEIAKGGDGGPDDRPRQPRLRVAACDRPRATIRSCWR